MHKHLTRNLLTLTVLIGSLFGASFFIAPTHAATPPTPPNIESLPAEIQSLLKKDPSTLTDVEKKQITNAIMLSQKDLPPALRASLERSLPQAEQSSAPSFPENTESCFNLFHFGGVQVNVGPSIPNNTPGTPVTFVGTLENTNTYPVVGIEIYVKIFKVDGSIDGADEHAKQTFLNGYPVVDQFVVLRDLSIDAKGSNPLQFSWNIPKGLLGGTYEAAFYIVGNNRFNIMGLSFSDDVSGTKAPFTVKSTEATDPVAFDKASVTTNGKTYNFARPPLVFGKDEPVLIKATMQNPSDTAKTVTVKHSIYNWDSQRSESLLEEATDTLTIPPKGSKDYTYNETKHTGTVTLAVLTLDDHGVKSILNVRFARPGANETRLSFSSITKFPLTAGEENTLFTCGHSTFGNNVDGNDITLALTDDATGEKLASYTYSGVMTSNMMAVKKLFTPTKSSNKFTLTATLKNNGKIIDTFSEHYDCQAINPALCETPVTGNSTPEGAGISLTTTWKYIVYGLTVILILIIGTFWYIRHRKDTTI